MAEITLTRGRVALVDDEDQARLAARRWHCTTHGYAARTVWPDRTVEYMHHAIVGHIPGLYVDHINRDKLDNRKANLRHVDGVASILNTGLRCDNRTGTRGVSWSNANGGYIAQFRYDGRRYHVGTFPSVADATEALELRKRLVIPDYGKATT